MIAFDYNPPQVLGRYALTQHGPLREYQSVLPVRNIAPDFSHTILQVVIGETTYRLRRPLTLRFYPCIRVGGMGELIREPDPELENVGEAGEPLDEVGVGGTLPEAYQDWADKLHVRVQSLLDKRPWEMSPDERREMAFLEHLIDLPMYHRETPIRTRQVGTVLRSHPYPDKVQWEDGTHEVLSLSQMPGEFAAYRIGQRFEAITLRDPSSGRLQRVTHLPRMGPLAPAPADEWEKVPTTSVARQGDWNEFD